MFLQNLLFPVALFVAVLGAETGEQVNCTALAFKEECCKNIACIYTQCQVTVENTTENRTGCHEKGWDSKDTCGNSTIEILCNQTSSTTTTAPTSKIPTSTSNTGSSQAPPDKCETFRTDESQCCNTTDCAFIQCTDVNATEMDPHKHKGCHMANASLTKWCMDDTNQNLCVPEPTESSTSQSPSTQAPRTTQSPLTDPCKDFVGNASLCCGKTELKCLYLVCQEKDTKIPHTGCHVNTTDISVLCAADTSTNICSSDAWIPKTVPGPSPTDSGQHFDGASFIGGIVLCLGLVALLFFGLKFYRSRADKNYSTL